MTAQVTDPVLWPRRVMRSVTAVLAGFIVVVVLSIGVDAALHAAHVYPPPGEPMNDSGLNLLALAYRSVFTVLGGYVAAWLAPNTPVRHAFILGVIGLAAGTAGVIVTWDLGLGPRWYPIALAVTGLPLTWLGGLWRARSAR
jgi:hypothetical protein